MAGQSEEAREGHARRARHALLALNFFMADMQAGIGPFLGVFLLAHGWLSGPIGSVMTIGGVAGMIMTTPAGALIDSTDRKRLFVVIPGICTVLASDYYYPAPLLAPFRLAADRVAPLAEAWRFVSAHPAQAAGLADRGTLEAGKRADIVVVDASDPLRPRALATMANGHFVHVADASRFN